MLFKDDAAYMISKTGLSGLSKAIAARLAVINGRSNIINPSYVKTPMTENSYKNDIEREKRNSRHLRKKWEKQKIGDIDLVCGGPPCQAYSGIGHRRSYSTDRKNQPIAKLYADMAKIIKIVKVVQIVNVAKIVKL